MFSRSKSRSKWLKSVTETLTERSMHRDCVLKNIGLVIHQTQCIPFSVIQLQQKVDVWGSKNQIAFLCLISQKVRKGKIWTDWIAHSIVLEI